jgi:hypothetical protein
MPQNVYGPEADEEYAPVQDSDAGQNTPAGNPTDPRRHSAAANDSSDPRGDSLDNVRRGEAGKSASHSANRTRDGLAGLAAKGFLDALGKEDPELGELEAVESDIKDDFSFIPDYNKDIKGQSPRSLLRNAGGSLIRARGKYKLITGVIAGIISLIVTAFLVLIPLKIESIVSNIEGRFMASATSATQRQTDNLFTHYMTDHVLPALRACGGRSTAVINRHCNAYLNNTLTGGTTSPVHALYRGWRNGNLENKLARKYGIEFQFDRSANGLRGEWYLKTPDTSSKGDPIGANGSGLSGEFNKASRADMRSSIKEATSFYNVMIRFKTDRLLAEKYAVKYCVVYCGVRDAYTNAKIQAKYAAKMFLIERVVQPRSAALSAVLGCILVASSGCDGKAPTTCTASTCDELAGEAEDVAAANVEQAIGEASAGFGSETSDKLIKLISDIRIAGGAQTYVVNKVITKFTSTNAIDEVPVVGELGMLNQGLAFVNEAGGAGNKLQTYSYLVNAAAAVSVFTLFQSYADEIHTGHVTATEVGSFTNSLGPGNQCQPAIEKCSGPPVNGTASAENTPLYSSLIEGNPSPGQSKTYLCNNNKPLPKGKLVCPEENLGAKNQTLSSIDSALSSTGLLAIAKAYESSPVASVFNAIQSATSYIASTLLSGAETLLNIVDHGLIVSAKNAAASIFKAIANDFVPVFGSPDQSAGRTFDMIVAGGAVSGSTFTHTGLGGQKLTPTQAAVITQQQETETQKEFQTQPLFARLFSTDTPYSLISKVAVDIPFGVSTSIQDGFASLLNPLSALSSSFGSLLTGRSAAAVTPGPDPFGVTQYGYPNGSIPSNPEAYWNANCSDNAAQGYQKTLTQAQINAGDKYWNDSTTTNPDNGQQDNNTVNPCMLIKSAAGSAGATSDSSLLTADDTANVNSSSGSSSSGTTAGGLTNPFPGGWVPNRLDMGYDGTFKSQIVSPCGGTMLYSYPDTGHDANGGWNGAYFVVQCSQTISGLPSNAFYFAEGVSPTVPQGQPVTAGQQIGVPGWTGFGEGPGGIEWGLANPATPRETWAAHLGDSCSSGSPSQTFVLSFAKWVEQNLSVAPPLSTDNAGCA